MKKPNRSSMISKMERCKYIVIWLLMLPSLNVAAADPDSLFREGNRLYAEAAYQEAVQCYQQLADAGYRFYNLGNAHFKLNNIADAILNYERAYKLNPGDADVAANLRFVNLRITDRIEPVPAFFIQSWWRKLLLSGSLTTWSVTGVLCWLAGFMLLAVYLFARKVPVKRTSFYSGLAVLAASLLMLTMAYAQHNYLHNRQDAVIFRGKVPVKSAPAEGEKTLFVIHEGTKVRIAGQANGWLRVTLPNGHEGWIEADAAREI
jgi:tetratricopeptide (TPR) repeat protein